MVKDLPHDQAVKDSNPVRWRALSLCFILHYDSVLNQDPQGGASLLDVKVVEALQ